MTTTTIENKTISSARPAHKSSFLTEVLAMTRRDILVTTRAPFEFFSAVFINVFFLIIYKSTLGNSAEFLPGLEGKSYLGFILPLSVISAALVGASSAGQNIVRDIESGYFDKLLLTPISRGALVLGPMFAGSVFLAIQSLLVIGLGIVMGLDPHTGPLGVLALVGLSVLTGMSFAGFMIGVALRTGNAGAVQGASFLFFPLTFITASYVPLELLDGWLKTAARINPITYSIEAGRALMLTGWDGDALAKGLLACLVLTTVTYAFALVSLKARTARR